MRNKASADYVQGIEQKLRELESDLAEAERKVDFEIRERRRLQADNYSLLQENNLLRRENNDLRRENNELRREVR